MNNVKKASARDFEADRKICEAATAGPWYWVTGNPQYRDLGSIRSESEGDVCDFGNYTQYYPSAGNEPYETDIAFITEARTGWPAALDRIAELEAEVRWTMTYEHMTNQLRYEIQRYKEALREIDTHIRSCPEPTTHIIDVIKRVLPKYRTDGKEAVERG